MVTEPYPPFVVHFLTAFVIFSRLLDESGRMHCLAVSVARSLSIDDGRKISAPVCLIGAGSEADGSRFRLFTEDGGSEERRSPTRRRLRGSGILQRA